MPKSKEIIESEDDLSENEKPKRKTRTETKKAAKKPKVEEKNENEANEQEQEEEEQEEEVQVKKGAAKKGKQENLDDEENNGAPEKGMLPLSKNRFVNVSEFRSKLFVNIREYYDSNGKLAPGKKGISLSCEQWEALKKMIPKIDAQIKNSK